RCGAGCHFPALAISANVAGLSDITSRSSSATSRGEAESSHRREDAFASDFKWLVVMGKISGSRRGGVQPQKQAALRHAFVDKVEKPWIAVRVLERRAAGDVAGAALGTDGSPQRRLRALPGAPRFALDEVELVERLAERLFEVDRGRLAPFGAHLVDV